MFIDYFIVTDCGSQGHHISGVCVHGDISIDHQSANRIELSGLIQDLFDF